MGSTYRRDYYLANRERLLENQRRYAEKNAEKIRERQRKYREENREALRAWHRENRKAHAAEMNAKATERRRANPEKQRVADRAYYEAHRGERLAYQRAYREANGAAAKERKRANHYGLTVEQLRAVLAPGRCAICGGTEKLHVDHCHATGAVRGLLCQHCNRGLGSFRDRPDLLRRAAQYVAPATPQTASEHT